MSSNSDDQHGDIRQHLELTGLAYSEWERESREVRRLADRAAASGFADRDHLQRLAAMGVSIEDEIRMLDELERGLDDEIVQQVQGTRDRLAALLEGVREAERKLRTAS